MPNSVSFFLNGKAVTVNDPAPELVLIDYLRSLEVGLIGPKKPCGQGGCGGCTVILSRRKEDEDRCAYVCHPARHVQQEACLLRVKGIPRVLDEELACVVKCHDDHDEPAKDIHSAAWCVRRWGVQSRNDARRRTGRAGK